MCGIAGFIDHKKQSTQENLQKMITTLKHRGPDGNGIHLDLQENTVLGLAHARLAIIDLTDTGTQPMHFEDLSIVFNGEIYNHVEIRKELEHLGHSFTGASDTEVVLHAFQQWKEKALDQFIGMFAFVIYDKKKDTVFFARDRAGVKPLFVYRTNGLLLFASELKAFHAHPKFKSEIDPAAVAAFLQFGHVPTPHCIYKDCFKIKPGHYAT